MNRTLTKVFIAVTVGAALFVGGGSISVASQAAGNRADSKVASLVAMLEDASQEQWADSSSGNRDCGPYCAGGGSNLTSQEQNLEQKANTGQGAFSAALAQQHGHNVSSPVTEGENTSGQSGGWAWDRNSADQAGFNHAGSKASNWAFTGQAARQSQWAESSSGNGGCWKFCIGGGGNLTPQLQHLRQHANTDQWSESLGVAKQHDLNVNAPISIAEKANGKFESKAKSGGSGGRAARLGFDDANSWAKEGQQLLNVNIPITVVGWGSVGSSGGSATQIAFNDAASEAKNTAATTPGASQSQQASSPSDNTGCAANCTGGGGNITPQSQNVDPSDNTSRPASSAAQADQKVMNVNIPITIVGWGSVGTAGGSATQVAGNNAGSSASNNATTIQDADQGQPASSSGGNSGCTAYCTGGGGNVIPQSQSLGQHAGTSQGASSVGNANQGGANTNSPVPVG